MIRLSENIVDRRGGVGLYGGWVWVFIAKINKSEHK